LAEWQSGYAPDCKSA